MCITKPLNTIEALRGTVGHVTVSGNGCEETKIFPGIVLLMAEILHQLIGSLSHYLQGFIHTRWCRISAINGTSITEDY